MLHFRFPHWAFIAIPTVSNNANIHKAGLTFQGEKELVQLEGKVGETAWFCIHFLSETFGIASASVFLTCIKCEECFFPLQKMLCWCIHFTIFLSLQATSFHKWFGKEVGNLKKLNNLFETNRYWSIFFILSYPWNSAYNVKIKPQKRAAI